MVGLIFGVLALVLFFIITSPVLLILAIMRKWFPTTVAKIGQPIVKWGFKCVLFAAGIKVKVSGLENIPDEPVLYASNHRSITDIPVFYTTVPQRTGIISKIEIKKIPFLSWWMVMLNCLFLDRSDVRQGLKTILRGVELIKGGSSMWIMPEGTRAHTEDMLPFKEGSFKMAEKTGCPIVPMAIWKTDEILELHMPYVKPQTVQIKYLPPIRISELSKEDQKHVGAYTRDAIAKAIDEMK